MHYDKSDLQRDELRGLHMIAAAPTCPWPHWTLPVRCSGCGRAEYADDVVNSSSLWPRLLCNPSKRPLSALY